MKFHDDINKAFKPLFDYLCDESEEDKEGTVYQYMYMFHDNEKTYYKHFGSREYFKISHNGEAEGKLEDWREW